VRSPLPPRDHGARNQLGLRRRLAEIGEHQRARDVCEKILSHASPLLLYGEEIDPRSGRHLGNFPQAFTPLALINAVMHVIRKEQAAQRPGPGGRP
jgi:GH15 family glucan-1,4-alpha-glucosidase